MTVVKNQDIQEGRATPLIYMATGMLTAALQSSPDGFARDWPSSSIAVTAPSERY